MAVTRSAMVRWLSMIMPRSPAKSKMYDTVKLCFEFVVKSNQAVGVTNIVHCQ